jgi:hypothetical protein
LSSRSTQGSKGWKSKWAEGGSSSHLDLRWELKPRYVRYEPGRNVKYAPSYANTLQIDFKRGKTENGSETTMMSLTLGVRICCTQTIGCSQHHEQLRLGMNLPPRGVRCHRTANAANLSPLHPLHRNTRPRNKITNSLTYYR